jgi:hypothetical protein
MLGILVIFGDFIVVASVLLFSGLFLLWFTITKERFFAARGWETWGGRAGLLALIMEMMCCFFGPRGARITLGVFAATIIGLALWIMSIQQPAY